MERVPEPAELMNGAAQALAYSQADFAEPNTLFLEVFRERFPGFASGHVVDLACGPADIPIRFARRWPGVRVTATDGAPSMLALAREAVAEAGLAERVRIVRWHVGGDPVPAALAGAADAVTCNAALHHVADPAALWAAVRAIAAPGAAVLVMDLERPPTQEAAARIVARHARDEPEVLRRDFFNSLLAAYRVDQVRAQLDAAGLGGGQGELEVATCSDRHLCVAGSLP